MPQQSATLTSTSEPLPLAAASIRCQKETPRAQAQDAVQG